ncbi:MAG: bifunctional DNA-formamidopyrimidine glycosylase/DNA-(apurinic or apyrimidinic site) lyase [Planctomycetaceae bacterium]
MPELPEVETMVRGIRPHVEGRVLAGVRKCACSCRPLSIAPEWRALRRRAAGQRVVAVRRVAKRIVLELGSGDAFVIEPRMTGLMLLADPPDEGHLRVAWQFADGGEYPTLWFWDRRGLGTIRLFDPAELSAAIGNGRLGIDALLMSEADWRERCARTARPIKVALLDQKLAAGIGNLYASEILHEAGIHPARAADSLSRKRIARLCRAVRDVLERAIRHEGSTLSDGTYRNALNAAGSYQNEHRVYARAGERCRTCDRGAIRRIVQAQRATFYCPVCQR